MEHGSRPLAEHRAEARGLARFLACGWSLASAGGRLLCLAGDPVGYRHGGRTWQGRAGELRRSARRRLVREGSSWACSFRYRRVLEDRPAYHLYCPAPVHSTALRAAG
jgi:hypothetical protein